MDKTESTAVTPSRSRWRELADVVWSENTSVACIFRKNYSDAHGHVFMDGEQKQVTAVGEPRRAVLQKCGVALAGIGANEVGVYSMSTSARASSTPNGITVSSGSDGELSYEIRVTGSI